MADDFELLNPEDEEPDLPEDLDDLEVDDPDAVLPDGDDSKVPELIETLDEPEADLTLSERLRNAIVSRWP